MRKAIFAGILLFWAQAAAAQELGLFEGHSDIGSVVPPGTASFVGGEYTITSAGANVWARVDAFHYLWKKMSGDVVLTGTPAGVGFPKKTFLKAGDKVSAEIESIGRLDVEIIKGDE